MVPNLNRCHLHSIFEYIVTKCSLNIDKWTLYSLLSLSTMTTFMWLNSWAGIPSPETKAVVLNGELIQKNNVCTSVI